MKFSCVLWFESSFSSNNVIPLCVHSVHIVCVWCWRKPLCSCPCCYGAVEILAGVRAVEIMVIGWQVRCVGARTYFLQSDSRKTLLLYNRMVIIIIIAQCNSVIASTFAFNYTKSALGQVYTDFTLEARPPAPFLEKEVLNLSSESGCVV